jgi:hypothetical protein
MNAILRDFLQKFVIVYFDDVFLYSRTLDKHLEHLRLVFQRFKEEGLKLRFKKCFFGLQDMEYLGYTHPHICPYAYSSAPLPRHKQ